MKRRSDLRNGLSHAAPALPALCAALFLVASPMSQAQSPGKPAMPDGADASGAVIVPPVTDPGIAKPAPPIADMPAVKPPPVAVDPNEVRKLQQEKINGAVKGTTKEDGTTKEEAGKQSTERRSGGISSGSPAPAAGQPSEKAECKGPAELCKQDSAR